ncbi:glycoprotein-N-acetylgalactosamine 3-beta-galactosyltransferase 1-like [Antedon mediterranea]|uniref:glycoprotein-N-acetylgalactosamine 3-beta-galactosyltransferase 1-like n=1 Tax=Antedon mediterranea TaxID=105859 RepID=UPI003AF99B40
MKKGDVSGVSSKASRPNFMLFIVGVILGCCMMSVYTTFYRRQPYFANIVKLKTQANLDQLNSLAHVNISDPHGHIEVNDGNKVDPHEKLKFKQHKDLHYKDANQVAKELYDKVRVLCWIMTSPQTLDLKASNVKETWAKRCNVALFISSENNPDFPTVKIETKEGREYLWQKTRGAFQYIYENYLDKADWFLKGDDDTFIIVENLRYFLSDKNTNEPLYYGRKFKPYVKQGYMSGGAGYVLSKAAVKKLVEVAFKDSKKCRPATAVGGAEDVDIGRCLQAVEVVAGDSRDELGQDRFHPFVPEHHLIPGSVQKGFWYWKYIFYPSTEGLDCCSDNSISFHYISPQSMYLMEYLVYHMKPFGVGYYTCKHQKADLTKSKNI